MGFDMRKMMKQAQKMQSELARVQEALRDMTVEASVGGGVVQVVVTGAQEVRAIHIQEDAIDPADREGLEDLVLAAVNEGLRKSLEMARSEMAKVTGGAGLAGLM